MFGFAAFMGFLMLAANVTVGLWARSAATAITFDEARRLAYAGPACLDRVDAASDRITSRIGGWWRRVDVEALCSTDVVTVRVSASASRSALVGGSDRFDRTIVVRIEAER